MEHHFFRRGHSFCMFGLFNGSYGTTARNGPEIERWNLPTPQYYLSGKKGQLLGKEVKILTAKLHVGLQLPFKGQQNHGMFEENSKRKQQLENYSKISQQKDFKEIGTTKKCSVSISYNTYFKVSNDEKQILWKWETTKSHGNCLFLHMYCFFPHSERM